MISLHSVKNNVFYGNLNADLALKYVTAYAVSAYHFFSKEVFFLFTFSTPRSPPKSCRLLTIWLYVSIFSNESQEKDNVFLGLFIWE